MEIKNIIKNNNIFLAPMAGITDSSFRTVCRKWGAGMTYSEMVSAKGLYYKDKKTHTLMQRADGEVPYAVQIFGSEPEIMAAVAPEAAQYCDVLDINMGCPAPKIVNNGDGCALMKNPELMGEIVRAVADSVDIPVTVKMRMGWDESCITVREAARLVEENGATAITVHGRVRKQFYSGKADWDIIKEIKESVKIPVVGNGDIFCAQDAVNMMELTGCDAVMVARGAQGNPFIFRQIHELIDKGEVKFFADAAVRVHQAVEHTRLMIAEKGEARAVKEARKHLAWYIKGLKNSSKIKGELFRVETLEDVISVLDGIEDL